MLGYVEKFVNRPNYCYIRLICIQNYKNTEVVNKTFYVKKKVIIKIWHLSWRMSLQDA